MAPPQGDDPLDPSPKPATIQPAEQTIQKSYSCVICAQRKVKCDRRPGGCDNCTKAKIACIYKAPPPPRRRKKGVRDLDTTARLRLYEDALRNLGVDPEEIVRQESAKASGWQEVSGINDFLQSRIPGRPRHPREVSELGVLVTEKGKSRYLENGIWTSLTSEFREPKELLEDSSDEDASEPHDKTSPGSSSARGAEVLFGAHAHPSNLRDLHLEPVRIFKLWQAYLDNVSPLVKVFHAPTVQQHILNATCDLDDIPRNVEALMFAIYCITLESLSGDECIAMIGESKDLARQRFRSGAQQALMNASFLRTSDIMILQAFTLYVLSLHDDDARVVWIFSGIAQRIGQRIGLHRDGNALKLSPFDTEIRRRLWWQIMMLEGFSQKLAGTATSGTILMGDVKMPLNINDSDLFPEMNEPPKEHEGATEMMFFLIRCMVGEFLKRSADNRNVTFDGVWNRLTTAAVQVAIKDKAIDELDALFQEKFLRHCDPSITWHLMCIQLGRAIIFMMRFMAHSTDYSTLEMSQQDKDILFDISLQVAATQNLAYTMPEMHGFMWHVNVHFQWKAFIYLISELRYRTEGDQVEQAWREVAKSFQYHPSFDKDLSVKALPIAVSTLALKAWDAYVGARGMPPSGEPEFLQKLRTRNTKSSSGSTQSSEFYQTPPAPTTISPFNGLGIDENKQTNIESSQPFNFSATGFDGDMDFSSNLPDMNLLGDNEDIIWDSWNDLMVDFQSHDANDFPMDLASFNLQSR